MSVLWSGHPKLWVCGSARTLSGVSPGSKDYCNKVELVWMVEVMLAQTSSGTAFLRIATKDPAVGKRFGAAMLGLSSTVREHAWPCCLCCNPGGVALLRWPTPAVAQGFAVSIEPPCSTDLVAGLVSHDTRQGGNRWCKKVVLVHCEITCNLISAQEN